MDILGLRLGGFLHKFYPFSPEAGFLRHLEMLEKASRQHAGSVCLSFHGALDTSWANQLS